MLINKKHNHYDLYYFSSNDNNIEKIQLEILKCILKFANNTDGLRIFFKQNQGHELVAECIDYKKPTVSIQAFKVNRTEYVVFFLMSICF